MARLHEFEGKRVLAEAGIHVPEGGPATTPDEAAAIARRLNRPVVVKMQAWTTSRAAQGGIAFANSPDEAADAARRMLGMKVGQFPVEAVLIEEKLAIKGELFVSVSIDEAARAPVLLLSAGGGSGVEGRAAQVQRVSCTVDGPDDGELTRAVALLFNSVERRLEIADAANRVFTIARAVEARSLEINPLAITDRGLVAADCRITIDDYAVFRHPELGIEIARELDHPPTALERIAYRVEQDDHRGTFFFAQMNTEAAPGSKGLIGFHGAGGGGSMMSMDAITAEGFTIANFCDTSGNPSPAKVYRAARIILQQPGLVGYFGSGSGVANQEQYWSAYGLAKAFWELDLDIPAVIRLGGNTEDRAVEILQNAGEGLPAPIEGYKKTDAPAKIASRFADLVSTHKSRERERPAWSPRPPRKAAFVGSSSSMSFPVKGGRVWIDSAAWKEHGPAIIARSNGLFRDDGGKPAVTVRPDELLSKDSDLIACEVECRRDGVGGPDGAVFVELDIPDLSDAPVKGPR
jgi:succinyl-CoA synthetase beta subunit